MPIDIRRLSAADAHVLDDLDPDVFDDPLDPAATTAFLADPRHHLVVALDAGRVVGFVSAVHYLHPDKARPELWINEVGVAATHHGQGIGKGLLRAALAIGRDLGCETAWVLTDRSNAPALRLYASAGGAESPDDVVMFEFALGAPGAEQPPEDPRPDFLALWDFRDPAASEVRFRAALDTLRPTGDRSRIAQLLSQIARTQGLRRDFDAARRTLDEAEALLAGHDLPVARLRCQLERGRTFDSPVHPADAKDTTAARRCFLQVFEDGQRLGIHGLAMDAAHMLGIVEPPDAALDWNRRAIALAEASPDPDAQAWLGSLYNNTGWAYHERGDFATALALFEKARDWRAARGVAGPLRIARWCVARCLRSLGRLDEALAIQRDLVAAYAAAGEEEVGYAAEEIGECLLALGRADEARPWFARAFTQLSAHEAWLLDAEPARMARLEALGTPGGA